MNLASGITRGLRNSHNEVLNRRPAAEVHSRRRRRRGRVGSVCGGSVTADVTRVWLGPTTGQTSQPLVWLSLADMIWVRLIWSAFWMVIRILLALALITRFFFLQYKSLIISQLYVHYLVWFNGQAKKMWPTNSNWMRVTSTLLSRPNHDSRSPQRKRRPTCLLSRQWTRN